ncbi:MAG: bacterio-opsin activator domain-containing protein [Euryarchaeota archaeon]|nr:bacterio-opsin activator domain-containing protein [Euryarchaeota archaeon]
MGSFQSDTTYSFEAILDKLPAGIVVLSADGTVQYANATVERLFGYSPVEIVGEPFGSLFATDKDAPPRTDIVDALETVVEHGSRAGFRVTGRHRDGTESVRQLVMDRCELDSERYLFAVIVASTDENTYEHSLAELSDCLQELPTAESPSEIYTQTVETARGLFDHSIAVVETYDEAAGRLDPTEWTPEAEALTNGPRLFSTEWAFPWRIFSRQEGELVADVAAYDRIDSDETSLRSAILLPIGSHGVFIIGATEPDTFTETEFDIATILVAATQAARERVDHERRVREKQTQLNQQSASLDRLRRLNDITRELTSGLTEAESRAEIYRTVCERLVTFSPYQFAWFGARNGTGEVVPKAAVGSDGSSLETFEQPYTDEPTAHGTVGRALDERTPQVDNGLHQDPPFEPWREAAIQHGYRAAISIPVIYQGTLYGIITVFASEADTFDSVEVSVLQELGGIVGYALNADERRQSFVSDQSIELEFAVHDRSASVFSLATDVGGVFTLENLIERPDGTTTMFFAVSGATAAEVVAWADDQSSVTEIRLLTDREEECLFECVLEESTVWSQLLQRGGMVQDATAAPERTRIVIRIPRTADPRTFETVLQKHLGTVDLVARREYNEPIQTAEQFETEYQNQLTERQREVLQTAYYAGFFEWPRETNAGELADILGIAQPTVSRHLRTAERELFSMVYDDR